MTSAYPARGDHDAPGAWRNTALWGAAALLVIAAHGGAAWMAMSWRSPEPTTGEPPEAIMIDLAPVAVSPAAEPDVAPGPKVDEAEPARAAPLADVPRTETPPPPLAPEVTTPLLPQVDKAEAVLAPPPPLPPPPKAVVAPKPAPAPVIEAKPKSVPVKIAVPKPKPRRVDPAKPLKTEDDTESHHASVPRAERAAAATAAPSSVSSESRNAALASWSGELHELLNRNIRYPSGATGEGSSRVSFTINRSGAVLSARLVGSSGDPALDAEAVALVRRVSPVPPPPPEIAQSVMTVTAPLRFRRQAF